jgi:chloramphenicol-sensitive protein RarD
MSCLLAVLWFEEPFRSEQRVSFGLIWAALALFTVESVLATRRAGSRRILEAEVSPVPSLEARHDL